MIGEWRKKKQGLIKRRRLDIERQRIARFTLDNCNRNELPLRTVGNALLQWIKSCWSVLNGPGNDPIVFGLITALGGILLAHVMAFMSFRARLKDKDERIADLVEQRNKFQNLVLNGKGLSRKSTK